MTLATKDDLHLTKEDLRLEMAKLATKEELRDEVAKLATKEDVADARRYALMLNEATRDDIRLLAEHMLTQRIWRGLPSALHSTRFDRNRGFARSVSEWDNPFGNASRRLPPQIQGRDHE